MSFLKVAWAVAKRNAHNGVTNPALLIPSIAAPLVFFIVFAGGMSGLGRTPGFDFPGGYTTFSFVFILVQSSMFLGVFGGIGMAEDFKRGFVRRLMLAAPARGGVVAGYAFGSLARMGISFTVLTVAGLIGGVNFTTNPLEILLLLLLMVGLTLSSSLWALGVAMRLRTPQSAPLMITPIFLTLFLAPAFVPLHLLDGWIRQAANWNPLTALLRAARGLIISQPDQTGIAYAVLGGMLVFFTLWSWRGLKKAEAAG